MLLWLWSVAAGEAQYQQVQAFWASRPGHITLLCLGYAGIYHLVNGLRHIAWDVGWLRLDVSHVRYSAWWLLGFMAIAVLLLGWLAQGRLA
jgi:succinate dehydrogenase / fumarate reductase cytochrome b subunit